MKYAHTQPVYGREILNLSVYVSVCISKGTCAILGSSLATWK